ncbi:MlaD family protein [Shimwellia blattae]|uniref:Mammalian cell entry related protein n=1 Tax=Shimwellia blattae (strain ATCC 29907 / DSM 4481 / JCM 1650 / NBRC 105725 / CDC 9005-74) TaxID=630626 RepID=I2B9J8_SHIBC|nr:MlaD family protein [Shimwellia blattae]AFJ47202.1 mammalian cell entry related protein [Shimwellia blattae DSM 4481 = NBRC 105725]GAB82269.1 putative ABC transporter periplasmic protein [Shimwellia blattae DSM 4481 = NBRC 105725]VDY64690.1 virulence factor Mce family protein [Shimwellia blattae]VEC22794.1 virulence factor Mce family protein [Shimwellia blattae]
METRASYVIIGLFVVLTFAGGLLAVLWLSHASNREAYHYYDIVFNETVSGLSYGSKVEYSGIQIGTVSTLKLDKNDPATVWARIKVAADTPVKQDTVAMLAYNGITGTSIIQLSLGSAASPPLETSPEQVAVIRATPSPLRQLLTDGGDLMSNVNGMVSRLNQLLSEENMHNVASILKNVDKTTNALENQNQKMSEILNNVMGASLHLNQLLARADGQSHALFRKTDRALGALEESSLTFRELIKNNQGAINSGLSGFGEFAPLLQEMRYTLQILAGIGHKMEDNPGSYLLNGETYKEYTPQ